METVCPRNEFHFAYPTLKVTHEEVMARLRLRDCAHPRACPHAATQRDGRPFYRVQCPDCGAKLSHLLPHSSIPQAAGCPPWNEELYLQHVRCKHLSYEEARGEIERERKAEWKRVHDLYLQSDQWRAIRSRVLDRAKGLCEGCRLATAEQVHHHTYDNAGHEFMFELAALCAPCHERYHASKRRRRSWS